MAEISEVSVSLNTIVLHVRTFPLYIYHLCLQKKEFFTTNKVISEGDWVVVYVNFGTCHCVRVKRGHSLQMRYGTLRHEFLIGKPYGSRVSATAGTSPSSVFICFLLNPVSFTYSTRLFKAVLSTCKVCYIPRSGYCYH